MLDWPAELIAGMVVVDSPTKRFRWFPSPPLPFSHLPSHADLTNKAHRNRNAHTWRSLLGPANYQDVVDLTANSALTPAERRAVSEADAASEEAQGREFETAIEDGEAQYAQIGDRQLLGSKPLSVMFCSTINDFRKVYEYGLEHGYGDAEARGKMERCLEFFEAEHEVSFHGWCCVWVVGWVSFLLTLVLAVAEYEGHAEVHD